MDLQSYDKFSIYITQEKQKRRILERMEELAKQQERSVNFLVVRALEQFLEREGA